MTKMGEIITELREVCGLTQLELSKILHISNSSISAYELGQRVPSIEILIELSKIFDVTIDYLVGNTSHNCRPSKIKEKYVGKTTLESVIESLVELTPEQREAIVLVIDNMRFCAETTRRAEQSGTRKK